MLGRTRLICALCLVLLTTSGRAAGETSIVLDKPVLPPNWALLERALLEAHEPACKKYFAKYFDERGYLLCVERWGGDDGPDDAIETVNWWPILHALGASDSVLHMYKKVWEGHLRQYTEAKTTDVPFARDGMYYKEFPVMMDWVHNGEGITVFSAQSLSDPYDLLFEQRVRRFAGFYMNEDPQAANYDPKHKIIRSMFNGSRGPLLRKATGLDWAGDPIEVKGRFKLAHGEESYEQMVAHFKDYNDIVGDHPQNMGATNLALNAYMLTGEKKYSDWLFEYVDAWAERTRENGGIIPTNVGLDGTIGGGADGKWYGGVYGWGFTVEVPQVPGEFDNRNIHSRGLSGFGNAYLLSGDDRYLDVWRQMIIKVNQNSKLVNGQTMYPKMYGDDGWYGYQAQPYHHGAFEIWYWSQKPEDRTRVQTTEWLSYIEGNNPDYPETALRAEISTLQQKARAMDRDPTTPDTRLADDPIPFNPARVRALIELMLGGYFPWVGGKPLHCRVRYFDPVNQRPGIPKDVAALVETMDANSITLQLVNLHQSEARTVVVQTGGYAEHQCIGVRLPARDVLVGESHFTVRLAPGCGGRMRVRMKRYVNQPTMLFPWDR